MYESTWCGYTQVYLLAANAPPGTQVSVFDVAVAFCTIPILPAQQVWTCISWEGAIYMDPNCSFGERSSSGNFGMVADAAAALYIKSGVNDLCKWVDDFNFWHYPIGSSPSDDFEYSYDHLCILHNLL
jgi:hypothetical protein